MGGDKLDVEYAMFIIRSVSVGFGAVSIGCLGTGVMTLLYASPHLYFPFSTGSGVWTGITTLLISIFGLRLTKKYREDDPSSSRCELVAFYTLIIMDITFGFLHTTYSAIGMIYCETDKATDTGILYCSDESPRLRLVSGFSIVFGSVIAIGSLAMTLYLACGRKLQRLAGQQTYEGSYVECCNGGCRCYFNTVVA